MEGHATAAIRTVRILQIGDIHFPEWKNYRPAIDGKDAALGKELVGAVSMHPVQLVLRELASRIDSTSYDLIALMGDITSKGDLEQFARALKQLSPLLDVRARNAKAKRVVMVPGNHDVNRPLALQDGLEGKFAPLNDVLKSLGWPTMPIRDIHKIAVDGQQGSVTAFLLNTCLGCGEKRYIPSTVQSAIIAAIDAALAGPSAAMALDEYYEQLDTPALDEAALRRIGRELQSLPLKSLPVLIAHHNILPQREPRLAPYSELVNGGQLRRLLTQSDRPVLYLHGHIHDDPVEIISDGTKRTSKVVSVSAPCIMDGFNEITIYVARDGSPCGVRVHPIRLRGAAGIVTETFIDVSLTNKSGRIRNKLAYEILQRLSKDRSVFWAELTSSLLSKGGATEAELAATATELYFAGYIDIDSLESDPSNWRLEMSQ